MPIRQSIINRKLCGRILLISAVALLPLTAFATGGDTTFNDITTTIKGWMGGSLGLLFCLLSFMWLMGSLAGGGHFKQAATVFGACIGTRYGPTIIEKIIGTGATGSLSSAVNHIDTTLDLVFIMLVPLLIIVAYRLRKLKAQQNHQAHVSTECGNAH